MKTSRSDVRSGGIDRHTSETPRISAAASRAAAAGDDAERDAEQRRDRQREHGQRGGVGRGAANQAADGPVVEKGVAEIEPRRARHPQRPLRQRTAIEIELGARARDFGGRGKRTELRRDVARREPSSGTAPPTRRPRREGRRR